MRLGACGRPFRIKDGPAGCNETGKGVWECRGGLGESINGTGHLSQDCPNKFTHRKQTVQTHFNDVEVEAQRMPDLTQADKEEVRKLGFDPECSSPT